MWSSVCGKSGFKGNRPPLTAAPSTSTVWHQRNALITSVLYDITSHACLSSNVVGETEELNFKFRLILINFSFKKSHVASGYDVGQHSLRVFNILIGVKWIFPTCLAQV